MTVIRAMSYTKILSCPFLGKLVGLALGFAAVHLSLPVLQMVICFLAYWCRPTNSIEFILKDMLLTFTSLRFVLKLGK